MEVYGRGRALQLLEGNWIIDSNGTVCIGSIPGYTMLLPLLYNGRMTRSKWVLGDVGMSYRHYSTNG